jgi:hypothetical protein
MTARPPVRRITKKDHRPSFHGDVRLQIAKVNIAMIETWLSHNRFDEDHDYGVRNLVVNPKLRSPIE